MIAIHTDIAQRRILRLALGVSLSLGFSQLLNWPMSFISAVFTMFLLALPAPALTLKKAIGLTVILMLAIYGSMLLLLPFFEHAHWAGILLLIPALFACFYYTARGGSMAVGLLITVGITLVVAIGSVSIDGLLAINASLSMNLIAGLIFAWIAHALLPELTQQKNKTLPPTPPSQAEAKRNAFRSLVIVFPIAFILLFSSSSLAYIAVMMKVASMGQQASVSDSREMGRSLLESTVWGGLAAIIAWQVLSIWPSLLIYCLLIALASLIFGRYIFQDQGRHPKAEMATFAFLTLIVILAPAVMDGQGGSDAGSSFYTRLLLFIGIAIYGTVAVTVFDAFWPHKQKSNTTEKVKLS